MNSLNDKMCVDGLQSLKHIYTMYHEFFLRKDYDWWYEVQPGDVVVDIGACVGFFTCHALDKGASKVYAIEPNSNLTTTILKNASSHIVNKTESPLVIINSAIGSNNNFLENVYGDTESCKFNLLSFNKFIQQYNIKHIDFLKIDCEGGEYDILTEENLTFLKTKVKHIAVEVHMDCFKQAPQMFLNFRNNFLSHFKKEQIRFLEDNGYEKTFNIDWINHSWPVGWGSAWMIYITNF
jgi:FkbM family methyltransferase